MEGQFNMSLTWSTATGSVYEELTATLSFNDDDVNLIYVDWGDGESSKLSEANYQWVNMNEPNGTIDLKHTYTAAHLTGFKPIVQTVTSKGYVSRYYGYDTTADVTPYTQDTSVERVYINDSAPTAIMRVENRTVKSGIDNSIFEEGPKLIYLTIPPLISQSDIANVSNPQLEVEVLLSTGLYNATGSSMGVDVGRTLSYKKLSFTTSAAGTGMYDILSGASVSGASVLKVLSVKYLNPRPATKSYTNYDTYNKLKLFVVASGTNGNFYPVTYVSAGSPYKKTDDLSRYSTLDFSQSRAAASNALIPTSGPYGYRYDNGKSWFNPIDQWAIDSVAVNEGNTFTDTTQVRTTVIPVNYTYMPQPTMFDDTAIISSGNSLAFSNSSSAYWFTSGSLGDTDNQATRTDQFAVDDFGRFYDQYHFVRNTAQSNYGYLSSLSGNRVQATIFSPASAWADIATSPYVTVNQALSPNSWANGSGTSTVLSAINSGTVTDFEGNTNENAKFYMTLLMPKKTNKFFLNFSNYAQGLQYDATSSSNKRLGIGGIYYLNVKNSGTVKQDCFWEPLEFEDTTKITKEVRDTTNGKYSVSGTSFAKSGYISFDMPSGWDAINWKTICGGVYNDGGVADTSPPNNWIFPTASTDISVTGTVDATGTATGYGKWINLSGTDASKVTLKQALGFHPDGAAQMGAWKYIFYCTSGTASGAAYWIASGASNGWDGYNDIKLHFGETGTALVPNAPELSGILEGVVRRINSYEVMDGAWKGTSGTTADTIVPVGLNGGFYDAGANAYVNNTWNAASENVATFDGTIGPDWDTEDLYALKVVFDGESSAAAAEGTVGGAPVLNNIFAANEAYTALIKEVDDSAYSLNTLPITSDISYAREGAFYKVITRKGKVFITKTGIAMQEIGFTSVALGDESTATVATTAVDSLYGYLHIVRRLYEENVRAYWDEQQKDGTYVRLWGIITNVQETAGVGGPRSIKEYSFDMTIEEIALLDNDGKLMTNIFPLGGVKDERNFT